SDLAVLEPVRAARAGSVRAAAAWAGARCGAGENAPRAAAACGPRLARGHGVRVGANGLLPQLRAHRDNGVRVVAGRAGPAESAHLLRRGGRVRPEPDPPARAGAVRHALRRG